MSADDAVEEALTDAARAIREVGIGFLFAPAIHTAMQHAQPVRRDLGLRTVFNLLGPLTNPAGATAQLVGARRGWCAGVSIFRGCAEPLLAHVPAKWTPVRRKGHAPMNDSRACPDSAGTDTR